MDKKKVEHFFKSILEVGLGLDLTDPNLIDTPARIAKMYCDEWFSGVNSDFEDLKVFPNTEHYRQIICFDKIHFTSICSHHFLPFTGYSWLLYLPRKNLVGASKPARLIAHYSARPQLQENLTQQILDRFVKVVKPFGAMVVMQAKHECMACRGVRQTNDAGMTTSALYGYFFKTGVKSEALELIKLSLMR